MWSLIAKDFVATVLRQIGVAKMAGAGATMTRKALTARAIDALRPDPAGPFRVPDARCKGLAIRVAPDGGKTWDLAFRIKGGCVKRLSLGTFEDVGLEAAHERANALTSAARQGRDMIAEEAKAREEASQGHTVERLIQEYVRRRVAGRLRTAGEIERRLRRALSPLLAHKAADVRRRDLRTLLDAAADEGITREAEKRRATVSAMFKWGMAQDIIEANPSLGLAPYDRGSPRERVLDAEEIAKLWRWLDDGAMPPAIADVLKLQLLLGCRVSEAGGMRAAEFETGAQNCLLWTLPALRSKNGRKRVTPLVGQACEIVEARLRKNGDDGRLFVSETGADIGSSLAGQHILDRIKHKTLPIAKFSTHDLRRSMATLSVKLLGLPLDLVAALVGHETGGKEVRTLVRHYVHDDLIERKAIALRAWDERLRAIVAGEVRSAPNIVGIRRQAG
jgi:integrase